jgi:IS66 C-terminal element
VIAVIVICVAVADCILNLGGAWIASVVGAMWLLATLARFSDFYIGMNDPQLPALAITVSALAWALGRKNWTFAGSGGGGMGAAEIYTLIATAKLNDVDPQTWLADVLARLPDHPAKRIYELLPWNRRPQNTTAKAA